MKKEKPLGTIREEAAACRKAFAASKIGNLVWHCHHADGVEILTYKSSSRIKCILREKPERERAERLRRFRPLTKAAIAGLPKRIKKALRAFRSATDSIERYQAKWNLYDTLQAYSLTAFHRKFCGCRWSKRTDIFGLPR